MTTDHDTAKECADAFDTNVKALVHTGEMVAAWWQRVSRIPHSTNPADKHLDEDGALAATASAKALQAGDKIREAVEHLREAAQKLRDIGQGAACAEEAECPSCKTLLASHDMRYKCGVCDKSLCAFCLCQVCNRHGVTQCKDHAHADRLDN